MKAFSNQNSLFGEKKKPSIIQILNYQNTLIILAIEMPYYSQIFSDSKIVPGRSTISQNEEKDSEKVY